MTGLPDPTPPASQPSRWIKPVLVVSLALNLAVAGLFAGAVIRGGPPMRAEFARDGGRDPGLGLLAEGLSRADRMALRRALVKSDPDIGNWRERAGQEFGAILAALRAEPFDPDGLRTVLEAQSGRMQARLDKGRQILVARIAEMTPAERAEFATRLEERVKRLPGGRTRE
jgi:uncharacterized membrane protein